MLDILLLNLKTVSTFNFCFYCLISEEYLGTFQTYMIKAFCEISQQLLAFNFFCKR